MGKANCKRPASVLLRALTLAAITGFTAMNCHAQSAQNQDFLVDVALDNKISIRANNASLEEVLLEIQSKTGIPVNFVTPPTARVSVDITGTDLETAISKLWPNHMLIHGTRDGKTTIDELIIISEEPGGSSGGSGSAFLPSGQPAEEIGGPEEPPMEDQDIEPDPDAEVPDQVQPAQMPDNN